MNKHLLLTGGAGFIASHTVEHFLKNTDWNITILDRLTYAGNLNRLVDMDCYEKEKGRLQFVYHDFRSPINLSLSHAIESRNIFGPVDCVIHMGAESHVDRSIDDPIPFAESNVLGTVNILNYVKQAGCPQTIYVSTDEVYGPALMEGPHDNGIGTWVGHPDSRIHLHKEGEPHRPGNPYSASKAAAEDFCRAFANTYGLPIIITNTMNNFGERQDPEKFVPKVIRNILTNTPVIIHVKKDAKGNIIDTSSRCWLHARNHADALLFLLKSRNAKWNSGSQYNVTGDHHSVLDIAMFISSWIGDQTVNFEYEDFHSFRPGHDMHYGLNGEKMRELGWNPPFSLEDSLKRTVEWYLNHREWLNL